MFTETTNKAIKELLAAKKAAFKDLKAEHFSIVWHVFKCFETFHEQGDVDSHLKYTNGLSRKRRGFERRKELVPESLK